MKDEDVFAAALLLAQGQSPREVETTLRYSQGHTSRLIARAHQSGYVLTINRLNLSERQRRAAEERLASSRLEARDLGVREVTVCAKERFSQGAAVQLERLLRQALVPPPDDAQNNREELPPSCRSMAIAWGNDLAGTIEALRGLFAIDDVREEHRRRTDVGETLPTLEPIAFLPARGELHHAPLKQISPTFLAASLNEIVNAGSGDTHALTTIPAIVPQITAKDVRRIVPKGADMNVSQAREFIRNYYTTRKEFVKVFPHARPFWPDGFMTSVGSSDTMSSWTEECIAAGGVDRKAIVECAYGDIAGVFVAKKGYERQVESWNARWIGATAEDISRCAESGRRQNRVGVVLCARDPAKARTVYECLRKGWVNELIVSVDLGCELWRLVIQLGSPTN